MFKHPWWQGCFMYSWTLWLVYCRKLACFCQSALHRYVFHATIPCESNHRFRIYIFRCLFKLLLFSCLNQILGILNLHVQSFWMSLKLLLVLFMSLRDERKLFLLEMNFKSIRIIVSNGRAVFIFYKILLDFFSHRKSKSSGGLTNFSKGQNILAVDWHTSHGRNRKSRLVYLQLKF